MRAVVYDFQVRMYDERMPLFYLWRLAGIAPYRRRRPGNTTRSSGYGAPDAVEVMAGLKWYSGAVAGGVLAGCGYVLALKYLRGRHLNMVTNTQVYVRMAEQDSELVGPNRFRWIAILSGAVWPQRNKRRQTTVLMMCVAVGGILTSCLWAEETAQLFRAARFIPAPKLDEAKRMLRVRWDVLLNVALLVCYCGFLSLRAAAGLAQSTSPDTLPQQFLTPVIVVLIESRWYHLVTHLAEKFTHLNAMLERRLQLEISGDAALSGEVQVDKWPGWRTPLCGQAMPSREKKTFKVLGVVTVLCRGHGRGPTKVCPRWSHIDKWAGCVLPGMSPRPSLNALGGAAKKVPLHTPRRVIVEDTTWDVLGGVTHEVRWFGRAHWRLSDLVRNLDSYFGLQVLLFLAYRCVHLVTVFYSIVILNVDRATYPYRPIEYYTQTFWAFMRTGQLLADVLPCHGLTAQAKRTAKIAIQYRKSLSEGTRQQVDELLVQLAGLEVQFTAYGLFPIDNSIIISIASAVTTYLVVVMQFQNSDVGVKTTATVNPPM
ncbi:hypothetical protein AAG570_004865 [Ranatra chinensis]|uniref:Gustatory receptor n=1 Tax=Ranatra chinensis TaxID=642074 RepID=A0ABD0XYS0_9HEMI